MAQLEESVIGPIAELTFIFLVCVAVFFWGKHVQKNSNPHGYAGEILMSYYQGYKDCKEGQ